MAVKDKISEIEALEKELDNVSNEVNTLTKEQIDAVDHANKERLDIGKLQKSLTLKKKGLKKFMKDNDLSINKSTGTVEVSIPFDLKSFLHFVKENLGYSDEDNAYYKNDEKLVGYGDRCGSRCDKGPCIAELLVKYAEDDLWEDEEADQIIAIEKVFGKISFKQVKDESYERVDDYEWDVMFDGQVKCKIEYFREDMSYTHQHYYIKNKS